MLLGFPEKSADVRLAQYETGARTPKADLTASLANALGVSPQALAVPDIDSYIGLMHTLFTLEDRYGLTIDEADGDSACGSMYGRARMLPVCTKCSAPGVRPLPCSKLVRLAKRTITDGVTATPSFPIHPATPRRSPKA